MRELLSNDRPFVVHYQNAYYFPLVNDYPETTFGGDFPTPADYLDPFIRVRLAQPGNWTIFPPNRYGPNTINYFAPSPNPAPPSADNWLGTDDRGREDLPARLLYGFRVRAVRFALTAAGSLFGVLIGGLQVLLRRADRSARTAADRDLDVDARALSVVDICLDF